MINFGVCFISINSNNTSFLSFSATCYVSYIMYSRATTADISLANTKDYRGRAKQGTEEALIITDTHASPKLVLDLRVVYDSVYHCFGATLDEHGLHKLEFVTISHDTDYLLSHLL